MNHTNSTNLAYQFNSTEFQSPAGGGGGVFGMADGSVRAEFTGGTNSHFYAMSDLRKIPHAAPTIAAAQTAALGFVRQNSLFGNEGIWHMGEVTTYSMQPGTQTGGPGQKVDAIRAVHFYRSIDGLRVFGNSSTLTVEVGANVDGTAVPTGVMDNIRPIAILRTIAATEMKSTSQLTREFNLMASEMCMYSPKIMRQQMIYYENGGNFCQPCMMYDVQFTTTAGTPAANVLLVPAVQKPIEDIGEYQMQAPPPIFPDPPAGAPSQNPEAFDYGNMFANMELPAARAAQANPVQVGEYIVRQDHPCWLDDAKAFWANSTFGRALTFFLPNHNPLNRRDYWWDEPWCWEPALGIPDNSPFFVGQDHFALIEGHGAPWVITCLMNNAEFIHLNQIAGYGTFQVPGEVTAYVMWQSCDVIPEPGHAYEWDFTSPHSAFDVWWQIFKGMRGNFGYRTLMHICNGVGGIFGFREGLGFSNVGAWLSSTDQSVFHHSNGWDYGSCVIVSGHEGDTFYDNGQLPPPGSLTMWWIHA